VVAFDIETDGLRPYEHTPARNGLLSISFSDGDVTWALPLCHRESDWSPEEQERAFALVLFFLRSRAIKVAHNLPFELEWLTSIYPEPLKRTRWGDTMAQAYILDERRGGLSLDDCCLQRFGFHLKAQSNVDRARLAELGVDRLLKYNALDAKYTAKLYRVQAAEIAAEGLDSPYEMQLQRCHTLVKTQQVGLVVDFDLVAKFQRRLQRRIDRCVSEIMDSSEARLYEKETGKPLSPTSPPQLTVLFRDILKRPEGETEKNKTGYSVDEPSLRAMGLPMADAIVKLRTYSKQKSTYVDPCVPVGGLVYADGRLHPKFNSVSTVTGRLSSSEGED
jgi:DNA polymerase I-like protein with 3'-5' exonuclease and polymerase domains